MIRNAELSDLPELLTLLEEAYADTPFSNMGYNADYVSERYTLIVSMSDKFFRKVVVEDGKIVGVLLGIIDANFWGIPMGQTIVSYSRRDTHTLVRQFVQWSKSKGAKQVTVVTVPGKERYAKLIDKLGFFESGNFYTVEI